MIYMAIILVQMMGRKSSRSFNKGIVTEFVGQAMMES